MTTSATTARTPYRVDLYSSVLNPKHPHGKPVGFRIAAVQRGVHPYIHRTEKVFFDSLAEAWTYADRVNATREAWLADPQNVADGTCTPASATVMALSATGKSYQRCGR